jgi:hypothetical protein
LRRLKTALNDLVARPDLGGPATDTPELARLLSDRLRGVMRSNTAYFNLCIGLVVTLFVASVIVVVTNLQSPTLITAALGGFGIGALGLVGMMLQRWREKVAAEVLLELAVWFQGDQLRLIVNAMHRWMDPGASRGGTGGYEPARELDADSPP